MKRTMENKKLQKHVCRKLGLIPRSLSICVAFSQHKKNEKDKHEKENEKIK